MSHQRDNRPFDPAHEAELIAEMALDSAYELRRNHPNSPTAARDVELRKYIRDAVREKRSRDAMRREQRELELSPPFEFRSE